MDDIIEDWADAWLQQGRSEATLDNMRREMRLFTVWLAKPLNSAHVTDCRQFIMARRSPHELWQGGALCPEYAFRALRSFYGFAAEEYGFDNPMVTVKQPKRKEAPQRSVSDDEFRRLLEACSLDKSFRSVRDTAIIRVLAHGLRRTEVANLQVPDVMIEERRLLVRTSKNDKPRTVPLDDETVIVLRRYLRMRAHHPKSRVEGPPWLWLGRKGALYSNAIRLMLIARGKEADPPVKVTAHMFRRAFAVEWLSNGGSQVSLMAIAGWTHSEMPARYTRHVAGNVADAEFREMQERKRTRHQKGDNFKRR